MNFPSYSFFNFVLALVSGIILPGVALAESQDGSRDFDFCLGRWNVHHRQLKKRLAASHEWIEFEGTGVFQKILGGAGNFDDNVIDKPGGKYCGATFRTFDPEKKLWTIWWLDSRFPGRLDPPVIGRFEKGVGAFYAEDTWEGTPIRVRYLWTQRSELNAPRWEQAFSTDAGKTWETNWIMDFKRVE